MNKNYIIRKSSKDKYHLLNPQTFDGHVDKTLCGKDGTFWQEVLEIPEGKLCNQCFFAQLFGKGGEAEFAKYLF